MFYINKDISKKIHDSDILINHNNALINSLENNLNIDTNNKYVDKLTKSKK